MAKPPTLDGYSDQHTLDCERVLVTLLRGLGPWKDSVYLIGGLTPRYLVAARPPAVPAHARALLALPPRPCAMNVSTRAFRETPSARARVASCACTVFGTRATNLPDATPPLFGAGTGSFLAFSAAMVALSASRPLSMASSTLSPSEMHSAKSGNEMR